MDAMSRNIRLYPWYIFFRDALFWGPAFFLYFSSIVPLSQVLWLESIYYVAIAVLEVPSGYFSDRIGRRPTLLLSTASLALSYLLFFFGNSFWAFAVAQVLLAAGFACASGTDTSLHYESLKQLGREKEYMLRETRALRLSFLSGALAALGGGALAMLSLRSMYGASALSALAGFVLVLCLTEPQADQKQTSKHFLQQVPDLLRKSWTPNLRFFTLFSASLTVMIHIPYEFYQPYMERLSLPSLHLGESTPLVTGIHLALTMLVSSWFTQFAAPLEHRCRLRFSLLVCLGYQLVLLLLMGLFFHPVVAVLLISRTAAKAVATPLLNAELAPRLLKQERSTYFSIQSLIGRLFYGLALSVIPLLSQGFTDQFHGTLVIAGFLGLFLLILVWKTPFPQETVSPCCQKKQHTTA